MSCSIARTMNVAGEPWSPLIVRDISHGIHRFDDLLQSLGISRNILTGRLSWLVEQGVLEQRPYMTKPLRQEYYLTAKGEEFSDLLLAMAAWGDKWEAKSAGVPVLFRHKTCGHLTHAEIRCAECGEVLHARDVDMTPGPGAER